MWQRLRKGLQRQANLYLEYYNNYVYTNRQHQRAQGTQAGTGTLTATERHASEYAYGTSGQLHAIGGNDAGATGGCGAGGRPCQSGKRACPDHQPGIHHAGIHAARGLAEHG